jgi:hypothetical protein
MLAEQEKDFDNENYGLTDHRDYGVEAAPEQPAQPAEADTQTTQAPKQTAQTEAKPTNTAKQDGGRNE